MAILIQKLAAIVNVIDTTKAVGGTILQVIPLTSVAQPQLNTPFDFVELVNSANGFPTCKIQMNGLVEFQDDGGIATLWVGPLDDFVNKLNNEYFTASAGLIPNPLPVSVTSLPLPTGASSESKQDLQTTELEAVNEALRAKTATAFFELLDSSFGEFVSFPITVDQISYSLSALPTIFNFPPVVVSNVAILVGLFNTTTAELQMSVRDAGSVYLLDGTEQVPTGVFAQVTFADTLGAFNYNYQIPVWQYEYTDTLSNLDEINNKLDLVAKDGTDITTPTAMPAGGVGIRGWLSAIWTKINGTLAISAASLPLPTGAATATNQTSQITQETAINTKLALLAKLTDTQPISAASLPLPTGASTGALQTTGNTKLDSLISSNADNARGTTATNTSVTAVAALSSGTQTLLASAAVTARKGVMITNNTNRSVYILFGTGTANTTTSLSVIVPAGSLYEVPPMFANVAIQFSIAQATSTATILVSTVN